MIDEITRRAEQDLISPEEAVARFGVSAGTQDDEIARIKVWLEYKAGVEAKSQPGQDEARSSGE